MKAKSLLICDDKYPQHVRSVQRGALGSLVLHRIVQISKFNVSRPSFAAFAWHIQVCVAIEVSPPKTQNHVMAKNFISLKIV